MQTFSLNNQFGYLIKELRNKRKWSLRQAGSKSGLSAAYISMLERGQHSTSGKEIKVTPETISKLAAAYEYPYNILMIRAGYRETDEKKDFFYKETTPKEITIHESEANYDAYLESLQNIINPPVNNPPFSFFEETIGERIRKLRDEKKISAKDLSSELTQTSNKDGFFTFRFFEEEEILRIEDDELKPDSDFIIAISEYYKVSCDWILRGKEFEHDKTKLTNENKLLNEKQDIANNIIKQLHELKHTVNRMSIDLNETLEVAASIEDKEKAQSD
ncbi:helix-turn-helix domain-containing protein [Paenibacillus donghaensis]|uniref:helix-turn-helix domain-containing protein n=1 Tax=Paenibacillus donghaensis TaxID=414771 RepID=UPI0012FDF44B|nr:helix-turn-helix transcriptional regulator [Paenibacillus donghaensis]